MSEAFTAAAAKVADPANKDAISQLSNDKQLEIYGLYKQATVGDCNIEKPGITDPKGQAKFDGWTAQKGKAKAEAE